MTRVVVDVMPKPEILDPQGQAIQKALDRMGFVSVSGVRQGKRFEIELAGDLDDEGLESVQEMASTLLANTVIEDYIVKIES
jgi:phosphoribosylformylglycinamidine synthase